MTRNQIEYWRNVEAQRSNRANEIETNRSNLARENETRRNNMAVLSETHRANLAREFETIRSNKENERIGWRNANTNAKRVSNDFYVAKRNVAETERSNRAREQEATARRQEEMEISRRQASTAHYGALTNRFAQQEQSRANVARENQLLGTLVETNRSNIARETETARSNRVREGVSYTNLGLERSKLIEQQRHNRASEGLQQTQTTLNFVSNLANAMARATQTLSRRK